MNRKIDRLKKRHSRRNMPQTEMCFRCVEWLRCDWRTESTASWKIMKKKLWIWWNVCRRSTHCRWWMRRRKTDACASRKHSLPCETRKAFHVVQIHSEFCILCVTECDTRDNVTCDLASRQTFVCIFFPILQWNETTVRLITPRVEEKSNLKRHTHGRLGRSMNK